MGMYHGRVNDQVFHIRIVHKVLMHPFPDAFVAPAYKSFVDTVPLAVLAWQQSPLGSTASYPKDGFDEAEAFGLLSNVDIWAIIEELMNL